MSKSIAIVFLFACVIPFLPACSSQPGHRRETIAPTPALTGGVVKGHPVASMPIIIKGWSTTLVPLAMQNAKGLFEKDDPYDRGTAASLARGFQDRNVSYDQSAAMPAPTVDLRVSWSSGSDVRWHNIIAKDADGAEWLLLDRRGVIGRWNMFGTFLRTKDQADIECRGLLLIAVADDSNHDNSLDSLDARIAIVTDAQGRNPRRISPSNAQVWSAFYDLQSDSIYLEVVKDTTGDGTFGYDDDVMPYVWKRGSDEPATPAVSDAILKRAMDLLK